MSKKIIVKQWNGIKHDFDIDESHNYDDLSRMLAERNGMDHDTKFKFICEGKIITKNNFHILKTKSIVMAIYTPSAQIDDVKPMVNDNDAKPPAPVLVINDSRSSEHTQTYNLKQVKTSIIVFLEFIKNNPQLKQLQEANHQDFIAEIATNPIIDDIIKNILSQSGQISECMEKGQNIQVEITGGSLSNAMNESSNLNEDSESSIIKLSPEDEANINEIIGMGFDPHLVTKTYAEESTLNATNKDNPDERKEITLKKLLNL